MVKADAHCSARHCSHIGEGSNPASDEKKKKKKNLIVCDNKNGTIKKPRKNVKLYSLIRGNFEISVFEILRAVRRIYFFR